MMVGKRSGPLVKQSHKIKMKVKYWKSICKKLKRKTLSLQHVDKGQHESTRRGLFDHCEAKPSRKNPLCIQHASKKENSYDLFQLT